LQAIQLQALPTELMMMPYILSHNTLLLAGLAFAVQSASS
jgi:hypothetical protein